MKTMMAIYLSSAIGLIIGNFIYAGLVSFNLESAFERSFFQSIAIMTVALITWFHGP